MKTYKFTINGNNYEAVINDVDDNVVSMEVNGTHYDVEFEKVKKVVSTVAAPKPVAPSSAPSAATVAAVSAASKPSGGGAVGVIKSPLPGTILTVSVKEGDNVSVGTKLFVIEAMKMENAIDSDKAGVVKSVKVKAGDSVMEGDVLIEIA